MKLDLDKCKFRYKKIAKYDFIYITNCGSYQKLQGALELMDTYIKQNKIETYGCPLAIYLDDPEFIEENNLRCEIGYKIKSLIKPIENKFAIKEIEEQNCLVCEYMGAMSNVQDIYKIMQCKINDDGYMLSDYPKETYKKAPKLAEKDGICHIEIQMPVHKI